MTYKELYEKAASMLDRGEITIGDFNKMVKPLDVEIHHESHWIPVTERLSAMGKSVLMCDIDGDIYLGHRTQCGYYYPDFCGDRVKNVTAWCNLPEPYKGVTE